MCIFRCQMILSIPNVTLVPPLETVQQAVNSAARCILSIFKTISQWSATPDGRKDTERAESELGVDALKDRRISVASNIYALDNLQSETGERTINNTHICR